MPNPSNEQERNLSILRVLLSAVVVVLIVVGYVLYAGHEVPPRGGMRVRDVDATGYMTPPSSIFGLAGQVPRTGVERTLPDLPNGAVPPEAAALKNPRANDPTVLKAGKVAYDVNCAMCHGETGKGNGPVSDHYVPTAPDLTIPRVAKLPDGTVFYDITNGILSTPIPEAAKYIPREWHSFKNTMSPEDRWAVVAYVKSLRGSNANTGR